MVLVVPEQEHSSTLPTDMLRPHLTHLQTGERFFLGEGETVFGRGAECNVVVHDDSVSTRHATITKLPDGEFTIRDLASKNGTSVNGVRIVHGHLAEGNQVQLGNAVFEFSQTRLTASAPPGNQTRKIVADLGRSSYPAGKGHNSFRTFAWIAIGSILAFMSLWLVGCFFVLEWEVTKLSVENFGCAIGAAILLICAHACFRRAGTKRASAALRLVEVFAIATYLCIRLLMYSHRPAENDHSSEPYKYLTPSEKKALDAIQVRK